MKLKTVPANFGNKITIFEGITVQFDHLGYCEVKDDVGKRMLESYPSFIFKEDYSEEQPKTRVDDFKQGLSEQLEREINFLKEKNESLKDELKSLESDRDSWAEKAAEFKKLKEEAEKALEEGNKINLEKINTLELKIELMTSSQENLIKMCEKAEFPKEEWGSLTKGKMIDYILSKS